MFKPSQPLLLRQSRMSPLETSTQGVLSRLWLALLLAISLSLMLGLTTGCTDSEISGSAADLPDTALDQSDSDSTGDTDVPPVVCTIDNDCAGTPTPGVCDESYCGTSGTCEIRKRALCCEGPSDCTLSDGCIESQCVIPGESCKIVNTCSDPCKVDQDCVGGGPDCALTSVCIEAQCAYDIGACCLDNTQCDDGQGCTVDICGAGECRSNLVDAGNCCSIPPVVGTSFSDDPEFQAGTSASDVRWQTASSALTPTPSSALVMGRSDGGGYSSVAGAYVTTARFELGFVPAGSSVDVRFQTFVDIRAAAGVDKFRAYVAWSDGLETAVYAKADGPLAQWKVVTASVSQANAANAVLVFEFDSVDAGFGNGQGVLVDDLLVQVGCSSAPVCTNDQQCAVQTPCTIGLCVEGQCTTKPDPAQPGCCLNAIECGTPDSPCLEAVCLGNQCTEQPVAGCCLSDQECPQVNTPCLTNLCVQQQCVLVEQPNCCVTDQDCPQIEPDTACGGQVACLGGQCVPQPPPPNCCDTSAQCNDGNVCTDDVCSGNQCVHPQIPGCGCLGEDCCEPDVYKNDFEGDNAGEWYIISSGPVGWQFWSGAPVATSPPTVLYYGNPATGNYDSGDANSGSITSKSITLPSSVGLIEVSFSLFLDVEPGFSYDTLTVYALTQAGEQYIIYSKDEFGFPQAQFDFIKTDITPLQGQTIKLVFEFDTVDQVINDGLGVIIDDLSIDAVCIECTNNSQCNDNDPCTQDVCNGQICNFIPLPPELCVCDPDDCDDGNPCTDDFCTAEGACGHAPIGGSCNDGNACTTNDFCTAGNCVGAAVLCPSAGCQQFQCSPDSGQCEPSGGLFCDDGIACTDDACGPDGNCSFKPIPGCCGGDADCESPEPCIEGVCDQASNTCAFKAVEPCCVSAADCIDGNSCTQDVCSFPLCENIPIPGCCSSDLDCQTGDPCQVGTCDTNSGICEFIVAPECCPAGTQCDDNNACTANDTCSAEGACVGTTEPGCCSSADDCNDFNKCTTDSCNGNNQCVHNFDPFCCDTDGDCDDGNSCTADTCFSIAGFGVCQYQPLGGPGCCISNGDCVGDVCELGVCENFQCIGEPNPDCCDSDEKCDDGNDCTADFCNEGVCNNLPLPGCCQNNSDCVDGDPCTFDVCDVDSGICLSEPNPDCCQTNGECNDGNVCTDDLCDDGACSSSPVACPDDGDPCTLEICNANFGCISVPDPSCCVDGIQCDDGDPCTFDICGAGGTCQHQPIAGCCQGDATCDDGNPCTDDACGPGNICINIPNGNCCLVDDDCDDGNNCTANTCVAGSCQTIPLSNCCQLDTDCDDGNACSDDICLFSATGSQCTHNPSNAEGCCGGPGDCDVGVCVLPTCEDFTCGGFPLPGCCVDNLDCEDGQPCTNDVCLPDGQCFNEPVDDCCIADNDCDDGDPCTEDVCSGGVCQNTGGGGDQCVTAEDCGAVDQCVNAVCNCGICELEIETCDDGDACTTDQCVPGIGCVFSPNPDCCEGAADCDDGNNCTDDSCVGGTCQNVAQPDCCVSAADCDDFNKCTDDSCVDGSCQHAFDIFCCTTDGECDDGNACTQDTCFTLQGFGVCQYNPLPGPTCCVGANDCPPQACLSATCENFECQYETNTDCCTVGADCDDGDSCTDDVCAASVCFNQPNGSCCEVAPDCDDGNICTADLCENGACLNLVQPGCCTNNGECDDDDACTVDTCDVPSGVCNNIPGGPDCCTSNADCADGDDCTSDVCNQATGACTNPLIPDCCTPTSKTQDFSDPNILSSWTITPAQVPGTVTWWIDGAQADSPPTSLYMGNPQTGTFDNNGQTVVATARSTSFLVPNTPFALLEFGIWADAEAGGFDELEIRVVSAAGAQVVWLKNSQLPPEQYQTWFGAKVNLTPWVGQSIQLEFHFDSFDPVANDGAGIFIDDLTISGLCEDPGFCGSSAECNDGNACTVDTCLSNVCSNAPQPDCCTGDAQCDDNYACSVDQCVANECQNSLIGGCCVFNSECDDGSACTTDTCDSASNTCTFTPTPDCCTSALDCDDGDACTNDACVGGACSYSPTGGSECCTEDIWYLADFNENTTEDFLILGDGSSVGWTTNNARWWSPPFALYFGDPILGSYNSGTKTFGTAFSPIVSVPASAQGPTLTFQIYLDIETAVNRDQLSVNILVDGVQTPFWSKAQVAAEQYQQWITVTLPLPPEASGKDVRVVLDFDSVDSFNNDGEGIFVDDIRLHNVCAP